MLLNVTEEQSINGAMMVCTSGLSAATRAIGWLNRRREREEAEAERAVEKAEREAKEAAREQERAADKAEIAKERAERATDRAERATDRAERMADKAAREAREAEKVAKEVARQERMSDVCSAYRGGHIAKPGDIEMASFIHDLGLSPLAASSPFLFHGNNHDLSFFWKKADGENHTILLREYIDSLSDKELRKNVIATMTRACEQGKLVYDGKAYAITDEGLNYILTDKYVYGCWKSEQQYFSKLEIALKDSGVAGISEGDQFKVFAYPDQEPLNATVRGMQSFNEDIFLKMACEKGDILIPLEGVGRIAFKSEEQGHAFVKDNPTTVSDYQKLVKTELEFIQKQKEEPNRFRPKEVKIAQWERDGETYYIPMGKAGEDRLCLPADQVAEDGTTICFTIHPDQEYTVNSGHESYSVFGDGLRDLMNVDEQATDQAVKAGAKTVESKAEVVATASMGGETAAEAVGEAAGASVNATANTVAGAAKVAGEVAGNVISPAKAATEVAQMIYKVAGEASQTVSAGQNLSAHL